MPTLVSFWTNNWEYRERAELLETQCKGYGIRYDIRELESTGDWLANTRLKPQFIRDMLDEHNEIAWVDADSFFMRKPDLFTRSMTADIILAPHTTLPERHWHVGVMLFRNTPEVIRFIDRWVEISNEGTDEKALESAWIETNPRVSYRRLPMAYFALPQRGNTYPDDTVIALGLSKDETKLALKARQTTKAY